MLIWECERKNNFNNRILDHLLGSTLARAHNITAVQDQAWPCQLAKAGRTVRMWTLTQGPRTKCTHPQPLDSGLGARTGTHIRGLECKTDSSLIPTHWYPKFFQGNSSWRGRTWLPQTKGERIEENHHRFERNLSPLEVCINRIAVTKIRGEPGDQEPPRRSGCVHLLLFNLFSVLKLKAKCDGLNKIVPNKLMYLKTWSPVGDASGRSLGGVVLEEIHR